MKSRNSSGYGVPFASLLIVLLCTVLFLGCASEQSPLIVFAAASTTNVLDEIIQLYQETGGGQVLASYASSGALARQVESGAPADLFLSASVQWVDYLVDGGFAADSTELARPAKVELLSNSLVLIAPLADSRQLSIASGMPIVDWLMGGRLAIGDPEHVPAGQYAKQALENLGVWPALQQHLAPAENVRSALFLVGQSEAPLGIVYSTDAAVDPQVRIIANFPQDSHDAISYPALVLKGQNASAAAKFLDFLGSDTASAVFEKYGFVTQN